MTDNELLELAAKAYGAQPDLVHTGCFYDQNTPDKRFWNPLNDDGDALRLRNKLGMILICELDHVYVEEFQHSNPCISVREQYTRDLSDGCVSHDSINKTVRRAITKTAAEMWRQRAKSK